MGVQVPELMEFQDETRELGGQERGEVESEVEDKLRDIVWGSELWGLEVVLEHGFQEGGTVAIASQCAHHKVIIGQLDYRL